MRSGRLALAMAVLVGGAAWCAPMVWARGPATPSEVAQECVDDINGLVTSAGLALDEEVGAFDDVLDDLPVGTPVSQYLKLGTSASTRCEKIYKQTESKVNKLASKCVAKLTRLDADPSAFTSVESARESMLGALGTQLRYSSYSNIAVVIQLHADL